MDDAPTRTETRVLADRYALVERIGAGGAGVVWRGHDQLLDRTVAVKLLHADLASDPATTDRFRAEASAAAKLTHPHAVVVYDIGQDEDGDYLVMELVDGATLGDLLDEGPLPPAVAATIGQQIGRALGAAHARGLVHRDVKPANVLVTVDGVAKVADFGIARALGEATSRLTTPGHVMGTARYLAPEQLRDQPIDARADVYALGLLLHQSLTGRLPFGDGTAVEVASRRLVADLPPPSEHRPGLPPELDEIVVRATRLEPAERFADGAEFATALGPLTTPRASRELADRVARHPRGAGTAGGGTAVIPTVSDAAPAAPTASPSPAVAEAPTPQREVTDHETETTTALQPDARRPAPAPAPDEPARRRGRGGMVLVAVVAIAALVIAAFVALGGDEAGEDLPLADDDTAEEEGPPADDDAPAALEIVDGSDHDPFGSGEHPDRVAEAFDGDPSTFWRTQQYRGDPAFGGLKPGVGIWLDLGDAGEVTEVVVGSTNPGADLTLFAGDAPPSGDEAPEDWGTAVATVSGTEQEQRIALDEPTEARVWLLWFTSLPADGSTYRTTVNEVRFEGS